MKNYSYEINIGGGIATGSVVVPDDATDKDIRLAILDDLYEVSYKEMKEDKKNISNAFNINEVSEVLLLSDKEWRQARNIPNVPIRARDWWWLRSPGDHSNYATGVSRDGGLFYYGGYVYRPGGCVRPAFRISHLSGFKPGDKITVGNKTVCTVISEDVALADNIICRHRFDADNNNWETSELKTFINSDEFLIML